MEAEWEKEKITVLSNIRKKIAARKILRYLSNRFGDAQNLHEFLWAPGGPVMEDTYETKCLPVVHGISTL